MDGNVIGEQKNAAQSGRQARGIPHVLIVDNDPTLLTMFSSVLSEYGLLVTVSRTSTEAINRAMHGQFQYIVTDFEMPGMNGLELAAYLRKQFPSAIIIGMGSADWGTEFLRAGANDFLQKPFAAQQLASLLDSRCSPA